MSDASPAPPPEDEAVLGEVLVNQSALRRAGPVEEDPDLALAKMLQAQEQAWLAMAGGAAAVAENLPPAGGGSAATAGPHSSEGGSGEEQLTDEEMARRLQEEEEREFQQRLLALAGLGPAGGDAAAAGEGTQDGEYVSEDDVDPDEMTYEELAALGEAVGTVSKGIGQADIDALPVQQYCEVAGAAQGSDEQCPICRVEYEAEDAVKVLPLCGHYAHPECIGEWLKRNKVCCICNKEVLEEGKKAAAGSGDSSSSIPAASGPVLGERRRQ